MKFQLGRVVATPAALAELERAGSDPGLYLLRHQMGLWGDLSVADKRANEEALLTGARLLSAYVLPGTNMRIWIITEAVGDDGHRASTCLLLPSEY